jgi:hypothetical protein
MSKFRVRTIWGNSVKPVELSRSTYSFNELRDEVRVKHEIKEFQLRYTSPSVGEVFVQDDATFKKAVKDAEVRGSRYVEVKVISQERQPAHKGTTSSASQPSRTAASSSPATKSPSLTSSPGISSPPPSNSSNGNIIATFVVPGDKSTTSEKLTVKANQEDDHFAFVPTAAKFSTDVSVALEGTKLTFENLTHQSDGRTIKFTQAFNLPFTPNNDKTHVAGHILKLYFA